MESRSELMRRIKQYSLLAGTVVSYGMSAEAQVIFHDIDPNHEIGGFVPGSFPFTDVYNVDLNNDGAYDFQFFLKMYSQNPLGGYNFLERINAYPNAYLNGVVSYSINYVPWALKMNDGHKVPLLNYFYGLPFAYFAFRFNTVSAVMWNNVMDSFIGVRFQSNAGFHYGWIRLAVNTKGLIPNIIVKSYAYEATPEKHITIDAALAIDENEPESSLLIHPNPAFDEAIVQLPKDFSGNGRLVVTNVFGAQALSLPVNAGNAQSISLRQLPPGMYLVELHYQDRLRRTRLVKR